MADDSKTGSRSTTLEAPTDVNDVNPSRGTGQTPLRGKTGNESLGTSRTIDTSNPRPVHVGPEAISAARQAGGTTGTAVSGTTSTSTTPSVSDVDREPGELGSHPVGTGVGAAGGAATGAAIGGAVGGPAGALVGAAIGGIAGGFAGKGIAEAVNPTEEDAFWRANYASRPYAQGRSYDELRPAYEYGWNSRVAHHGRHWNEAENDLQRGWEGTTDRSRLGWHEAKGAVQDAWNRVDSRLGETRDETRGSWNRSVEGNDLDSYWRNNFASRPYSAGRDYADYAPAYRYGQEAHSRYPGRRYEDVEGDLQSGWDKAKGKSKLGWQEAKAAVRDAWDHLTGHAHQPETVGAGATRYDR